jgi:hypothetical protein
MYLSPKEDKFGIKTWALLGIQFTIFKVSLGMYVWEISHFNPLT